MRMMKKEKECVDVLFVEPSRELWLVLSELRSKSVWVRKWW